MFRTDMHVTRRNSEESRMALRSKSSSSHHYSHHQPSPDQPSMASPSTNILRRPVRVLIRTRPAQLQKIHPSINQADTKLIEKLLVEMTGSVDTTNTYHLITRISDRKRSGRVDIVFDYGVHLDAHQPQVMAFDVKVGDSSLIITELFNPAIRPKVNETVEWWRAINLKHDIDFPSRTDVRREGRVTLPVSVSV